MTIEQNDMSPSVYGLVLAGGKSVRMGQDKGAIKWHGVEQRYHMYGLLTSICEKAYISCRSAQKADISDDYPTIFDSHSDSGPMFALLSAFEFRSDVAWLVVACDLPLLDIATIKQLLQHRRISSIATTFLSPHDGLPEPLITIWEPDSYPLLQKYGMDGYRCPRKVLIQNQDKVNVLDTINPKALMNANTQEDASLVRILLGNSLS